MFYLLSAEMAQLSSYDSGNPETPETDDSVEVRAAPEQGPRSSTLWLSEVLVFQSRGATVPVPAPPPHSRTKTPGEEDFENIKLISNGAYG